MLNPKEERLIDFEPPDDLMITKNEIVECCNQVLFFFCKNMAKNRLMKFINFCKIKSDLALIIAIIVCKNYLITAKLCTIRYIKNF